MPSTLIYRELFGFYRKLSVSKTSSQSATGKEKFKILKAKKVLYRKIKIMLRLIIFLFLSPPFPSLCHLATPI